MVFTCEQCHYLFGCDKQPEQCPDCGKYTVRLATAQEQKEFGQFLDEIEHHRKELWDDHE